MEEHLKTKYSQKLALVQYVYDNHKSTLEILLTKRKDWINEKLREINWILLVDAKEPDLIDYAIKYSKVESTEEVDKCINLIEENIVNFKPEPFDWDWDWDWDDNDD
ncbi:MAG TPA: hypothetical protein DEA91_14325 [Paenibacillus sp.]|nr:hypothetical protein [Paenibacillus sp.]